MPGDSDEVKHQADDLDQRLTDSDNTGMGIVDFENILRSNSHLLTGPQDKKKVQVGKDQEKAQSEKDSHSKNRGGKKPN